MKTEAVKQQIINNYKRLSELAKVQRTDEHYLPTWGILYKNGNTSGFVNQIGMLERNRTSIRISQDNGIELTKKPFYITWKRALNNINQMLEGIIKNIDNKDIVTKRVVNILCFTKEEVERLSGKIKH